MALILQLILGAVFYFKEIPAPLTAAGQWFTVYGPVIDLVCLGLIHGQLHREGLRLSELLSRGTTSLLAAFQTGFLHILLFLPMSVAGTMLSHKIIYGTITPD